MHELDVSCSPVDITQMIRKDNSGNFFFAYDRYLKRVPFRLACRRTEHA